MISATGTRTLRILSCVILLCAAAGFSEQWEFPVEGPRLSQSTLTAFYFPSLGILRNARYPLYDNFSVDGSILNMILSGPNINVYYGYSHAIADQPLFPDPLNRERMVLIPQSRALLNARVAFSFLDLFQSNLIVQHVHNRIISDDTAVADYNFNRLSTSIDITYDARYSKIEAYAKGMQFLYPQCGYLISLKLKNARSWDIHALQLPQIWSLSGEYQGFFPLTRHFGITSRLHGESQLTRNANRTQFISSRVVGAYDIPGNYMADAEIEARFLHGKGIFWESPPLWYVSNYLFKFSPGFSIGYNGGISGRFTDTAPVFIQAVHAGPLLATRLNGDLISVIRFNAALASSNRYRYVVSFNLGMNIRDKPVPVVKSPGRER